MFYYLELPLLFLGFLLGILFILLLFDYLFIFFFFFFFVFLVYLGLFYVFSHFFYILFNFFYLLCVDMKFGILLFFVFFGVFFGGSSAFVGCDMIISFLSWVLGYRDSGGFVIE